MKILEKIHSKRKTQADEIRIDNKKYVAIFEKYLVDKGYDKNVIDDYLYKTNMYINDYVLKVIPIEMDKACSMEIFSFVESLEDVRVITPIKLFYTCMFENGFIKKRIYNEFINDIDMFERQLKDVL